ncbi:MAG: MFS transporter [Alphaproteobacteria bacterium]|nr:MFS transporter [Alphaproteobacteria bacterium]
MPAEDAEGVSAPGSTSTSGMAAFRHPDFVLYILGRVFSAMPQYMVMVAISYQVYDLTGDAMNLAYIGLASFAPAFGFALVTGYVADLFDRRLVVAACYAVMMVSALLFWLWTVTGAAEVWPVFVILAVMGTGRAFFQPASNALVPNLVPPALFPNAVAWNTSANKTAQVAGPALGGLLYLLGADVVYALSAALLSASIIFTLVIRTRTERGGREPISLKTLLAGVAYVFEKKIILGAITLDLFVVILGGVTALLPIFAKDILEVGPSGAGLLRSAMAAGAVASALALTQLTMTRAVGRILYLSVFIFGAAIVVFGLSPWFWLSMAAMATLGASDMVSVYIRLTLLQVATPDDMRGRVGAVNSVFTGASNEIGEFRAGTMAVLIGAVPAVLFGGIGSIVVAAACWKLFPDLVRIERMDRNL